MLLIFFSSLQDLVSKTIPYFQPVSFSNSFLYINMLKTYLFLKTKITYTPACTASVNSASLYFLGCCLFCISFRPAFAEESWCFLCTEFTHILSSPSISRNTLHMFLNLMDTFQSPVFFLCHLNSAYALYSAWCLPYHLPGFPPTVDILDQWFQFTCMLKFENHSPRLSFLIVQIVFLKYFLVSISLFNLTLLSEPRVYLGLFGSLIVDLPPYLQILNPKYLVSGPSWYSPDLFLGPCSSLIPCFSPSELVSIHPSIVTFSHFFGQFLTALAF